MPNQLQKSLQNYISKMKKPAKQLKLPTKRLASSTSWILRGCKHPRTPSFTIDRHEKEDELSPHDHNHTSDADAATLSDVDRFLFENFRSLYQKEYDDDLRKKGENTPQNNGMVLFDTSRLPVNIRGSSRYFLGRRSSSSSIIDEGRPSIGTSFKTNNKSFSFDQSKRSTLNDDDNDNNSTKNAPASAAMGGPEDFITLLAYTPNPYDDFKRSMHEMIEARMHFHGKVDWEFMEELLFCFLNMNDKKSYKFILAAFVDLSVVLRENSGNNKVPVAKSLRKVRSSIATGTGTGETMKTIYF